MAVRQGTRVRSAGRAEAVLAAADLDVLVLGDGPRVVFVHVSIVDGSRTWRRQLELADRYTLVIPNRPGFGASPPLARNDFEAEAPVSPTCSRTAPTWWNTPTAP